MSARELDRNNPTALWRQLQLELQRRVEAGDFPDVFPGENALAAQYQVSRQTVRLALRPLREAGIVTAARGRAPHVAAGVIDQPLGALYSLFASVEGAGMVQRSVVLALERCKDPVAAAHLGVSPRSWLVHLARIRLADEEPLALDRVWLPARIAAPLLEADFTHTALYREMADRCGVQPGGGRELLHAINLAAEDAQTLNVPAGTAAFAIDRLGCAGGEPVEWRQTIVRGDRFCASAYFSPTTGYQLTIADREAAGPPASVSSIRSASSASSASPTSPTRRRAAATRRHHLTSIQTGTGRTPS